MDIESEIAYIRRDISEIKDRLKTLEVIGDMKKSINRTRVYIGVVVITLIPSWTLLLLGVHL